MHAQIGDQAAIADIGSELEEGRGAFVHPYRKAGAREQEGQRVTDHFLVVDDVDDVLLQFDFATDSGEDEADAATLMDEVEQFLREQGDGK